MNKEYKYDAFISYRHCDLDKFVAENLHKVLETYELPKNLKSKLNIQGRTIKRVFRDQDELPLSSNLEDPIIDALHNSKYLIVICSPRLKESLWCKKEIETFKKIRGRENIFCVLIEGEPDESFPDEVLFDEKEVKDNSGKKKKVKEFFEPLAADVRGIDKKEVLKKIKSEKLRLIAPMYNLDYDDLKQRHRQRRIRRIITTSIIATCAFFLISLYSVITLLKISSQQKVLKLHQAESLVSKSNTYLDKDSKYSAVKSAYSALTKFKGVKMPYTSDAEYALVESLGVYDAGVAYKATNELRTKGVVDFIKVSDDYKYALTIDESEEITLWDVKNFKKIKSYADLNMFTFTEDDFMFIGNDKFVYISKNGSAKIVSIKDGKVLKEIKKKDYSFEALRVDSDGKYLVLTCSPNLYLYNLENYELINTYKIESKHTYSDVLRFTTDGSTLIALSSKENYDITNSVKSVVHVFNTKDLTERNSFAIDGEYFMGMTEKDGNIYLLLNKTESMKSSMVLLSYNYKDDKVNYTKVYSDAFGKELIRSTAEGTNSLALVHGNEVRIINMANGDVLGIYSTSSDIVGIYSSSQTDLYIAFTTDGSSNFLNLNYKENFKNTGLFELNLNKYEAVSYAGEGYFFIPKYENRVIYYTQNTNKKIKELDTKIDYPSDQGVSVKDYDKLKKKYNIKKKNLVKKIIYADNKKLLVVTYSDKTASIYNVKTKEYLGMIKHVDELQHYFGKDNYGRIYLGNISNTYILDKDYNTVGHIKSMIKLDKKNNKVIISRSGKYYSLPIYTYDQLLKEAKEYLK